jgi:hypothetical protein
LIKYSTLISFPIRSIFLSMTINWFLSPTVTPEYQACVVVLRR